MGIARSTNLRGVVLTLLFTAALPASSFAKTIIFSNQVPARQASQLVKDLGNDLTMIDGEDVRNVMQIGDLSDASLKQWLLERVGYVVGENENDSERLVGLQKDYQYQNPGVLPNFESPNPNIPDPDAQSTSPHRVMTVMANVGTGYYFEGKARNLLIGYKFTSTRGNPTLAISSPRVGIIKIGEGLFGIVPDRANPGSIVNTWFRLETLFHEAHHGDGNGKSLGYPHAVCPSGRYFNKNACDREGNGPYAVGALLLKQARLTCLKNSTCTAAEAEKLALASADSYSRLLSTAFIDPRPEGVTSQGVNSGI